MGVSRQEAPFPSFTAQWHTTSYPAIDSSSEKNSARTKNVIVTGGGSGIGAAIAFSFAKAGANSVALLGRTESKLLQTKATIAEAYPRTKVTTHIADVTNATEVDHAFSATRKEVGTLHVLINNAGLGDIGPVIKDADIDFWMNNMNTNVKGSLHAVQAFLRHSAPDATVVNVASLASFIPLMGGISAYAVSKAASVALFSALQVENPKLRVVNLQPGVVETEMNRKSGLPGLDDVSLPADFTVWLTGTEAGFTKGKYLFANWDVDELVQRAKEISANGMLEMWIEGLEHRATS